jgi:hypothetical protein
MGGKFRVIFRVFRNLHKLKKSNKFFSSFLARNPALWVKVNWTNSFVGVIVISFVKKPLCRAFWTLITLAGVVAFLAQSYFLIYDYLQYSKTTNIQVKLYVFKINS